MEIMNRKIEAPKMNLFSDAEANKVITALSVLVGGSKTPAAPSAFGKMK